MEVGEGFDDAVRGDNGFIAKHQGFEFFGGEEVGLEVERGVHDEGVCGEGEDEGSVWVVG